MLISMTTDTRKSTAPAFALNDYKTRYAAPCALDDELSNAQHQDWYTGTGIRPADHPLAGQIYFDGCGHCGSDDVLVIAAQWCVSEHSGDAYWDYEVVCNSCGKYTQRSFCEND